MLYYRHNQISPFISLTLATSTFFLIDSRLQALKQLYIDYSSFFVSSLSFSSLLLHPLFPSLDASKTHCRRHTLSLHNNLHIQLSSTFYSYSQLLHCLNSNISLNLDPRPRFHDSLNWRAFECFESYARNVRTSLVTMILQPLQQPCPAVLQSSDELMLCAPWHACVENILNEVRDKVLVSV